MRILLMSPNDGETNLYIQRGFEALGCEVIQFDYRRHDLAYALHNAPQVNPDFILITKGEIFGPEAIEFLNGVAITAIWQFDTWFPRADYEQVIGKANYYFSMVREFVEPLRELGVNAYWVPEAACPVVHKPEELLLASERNYYVSDITFIGSLGLPIHAGRTAFLQDIAQRALDLKLDFKVFGRQYGPILSELSRCYMKTEARGVAHNKAVMGARINLEVSAMPYLDMGQSARVYRLLAAGGFVLSQRVKGEDEFFKDGEHLIYFDDAADCWRKILIYLKDKVERERIAASGCHEVLSKHLFLHRAKQILNILKEAA